MKTIIFAVTLLISAGKLSAQSITDKLTTAWTSFEQDPQMKSAIASLYVIDATTGNIVFNRNGNIGLAPASTQKIITSATAYEILGKDFQYQTTFGVTGTKQTGSAVDLYIKPSGDPTLGSWRWKKTTEDSAVARIRAAIIKAKISSINSFVVDARGWESEAIPGGWIWDDVGNYYGAGADVLNWRENQYDLLMKSGKEIGDPVSIVGTVPKLYDYSFVSNVVAAAKGTGDNSYIYFSTSPRGIVRGTIPVNEESFKISGAMPSGRHQFLASLQDTLARRGLMKKLSEKIIDKFSEEKIPGNITVIHTETSPPLDSMIYYFLRRSINLYGEALARTIAAKQGKTASSDNGAEIMQEWWSKKEIGIDKSELNIMDGSGLSPSNRTTTHAQVSILQYAKKQSWFEGYYFGFPEFNGMKLKSGTINRVKSFSGYHTAKDGKSYILSFIVNNYNGSSSSLVQKMYRVLDVLK